jgi:hypothetical protein
MVVDLSTEMIGNSTKHFTKSLNRVLARFGRLAISKVLLVKQHFDIFGTRLSPGYAA